MRSVVVPVFSVGVLFMECGYGAGETYPNKPVRIVTSAPGGGNDLTARFVAQGIAGGLGQPVIVDNRTVTGSVEIVARSLPDGYTLLVASGTLWLAPFLGKVTYDPVKDFAPVTLTNQAPNVLVVHPTLPAKSVRELIVLAKASPGELNYAAGGLGAGPHLAMELFKVMAGVNIVLVNYRGGGPAVSALLGGQVQLMFTTAASVTPHVKAGRLRALAVGSAQPSALAPGLPTVAASGVPGYESTSVYGVFVAAKTPAFIVDRLNQETVRFLRTAEAKEKFFNAGSDVIGSSPEELAMVRKSEMARLGKVIKDAGISTD